eukprot:GEMP01011905.1.p1 GENE.GEMP01011905.1~~GEMP01011905.1.p1  ORF type:complete len:612 (+),score=88.15 GEMP01011905.1:99-1838(+)
MVLDDILDLGTPFVPPDACNLSQVLFLTCIYGFVLYQASNLISDGSELLLLVPSMAGVVGSIVLPVLGAIPDGLMVLFSGIGDDPAYQLSVGVGTLAGSTIMLLTVPWCVAVYCGRVDIISDVPQYVRPKVEGNEAWEKFTGLAPLVDQGVAVTSSVKVSAKFMLLSLVSYFIIFIPSMVMEMQTGNSVKQANFERNFALAGMVSTVFLFGWYLLIQLKEAQQDKHIHREVNVITKAIKRGDLTLRGAMVDVYNIGQKDLDLTRDDIMAPLIESKTIENHVQRNKRVIRKMIKILDPFFHMYDLNGDKHIDFDEFCMIIADLNERVLTREQQRRLFDRADADKSGSISFEEFVACMIWFALSGTNKLEHLGSLKPEVTIFRPNIAQTQPFDDTERDASDEDSEQEDMPADLAHLSPEEQQIRTKRRAAWKMGLGTLLLLVFSDPMVDCMANIGTRLGISPFYVSFVLAPIASNASELVAAYNYAAKRTVKMMTVSIQTLIGAACMNNTFCLCIFLAVMYFQRLPWRFTAEILVVILVEIIMGFLLIRRSIYRVPLVILVLGLYPLSLIIVATLHFYGFD